MVDAESAIAELALDASIKVIAALKEKKITQKEASKRLYMLAGLIEQAEWNTIEKLREQGDPVANALADLLEKKLRKGSGNA